LQDSAIASLPMGCIDMHTSMVSQQQKKTKEKTYILWSRLFCFDHFLLQCIIDWYIHLEPKGFDKNAPLFTRARTDQTEKQLSLSSHSRIEQLYYKEVTEVEAEFLHSDSYVISIFKKRAEEAKVKYHASDAYCYLTFRLALEKTRTDEEVKIIVKNFVHDYIDLSSNDQCEYLIVKFNEIDKRSSSPTMVPSDKKLEKMLKTIKSNNE
jgi:hypothetical protein